MPTSENPLGLGHSQKILQVEGDEKRIPNYVGKRQHRIK